MAREVKQILSNKVNLKAQLIARLRFSHVLTLPEAEFARMISEIENDPLFQKMLYPSDSGPKAILKRRTPRTRLSQSFYEVKEEIRAGAEGVDVEKMLEAHRGILRLIQKIGQTPFEKYFLYKDGTETIQSISESCGLAPEEVHKIQEFMTEFSIHSEFFTPSTLSPEGGLHYTLIARIEEDGEGHFMISFVSPHLAGGRYVINPERVDALKKFMNATERRAVSNLVQKLELVNLRQDTLQKLLQELLTRQENYLHSGDGKKMLPLSQREMSARLRVAPSTVCRAIYGKSVQIPSGREIPLKDLFLNRKSAAEEWVRQILEEMTEDKRNKLSDNDLREILLSRFRFKASRRSVNLYRRQVEKNNL